MEQRLWREQQIRQEADRRKAREAFKKLQVDQKTFGIVNLRPFYSLMVMINIVAYDGIHI